MSVVTISRQFGAGGRTLGKRICESLGYTLYDNELIQLAATHAKVSIDSVGSVEKESAGTVKRFLSEIMPKSLRDIILERNKDSIDEEVYVDLIRTIINEIAARGNAVIIGRASQYVLENKPDIYHVLVRADMKDRVRFLEKNYDLTSEQARKAAETDDRRRANLYRKFGKSDYDDPIRYHLVINTSKMNIEKGLILVCEMVKRSS
ncbi:MAG: cytidylate kinase-like family protein [Thermodesulfobacteriota bacterium]